MNFKLLFNHQAGQLAVASPHRLNMMQPTVSPFTALCIYVANSCPINNCGKKIIGVWKIAFFEMGVLTEFNKIKRATKSEVVGT